MNLFLFISCMFLLLVYSSGFSTNNASSRPKVVKIGAILSLDSTIGRVSNIAIQEAVKDVNSNSNILPETKLVVTMQNSNCTGFMGLVEAMQFMETDVIAIIGPQSSVVAHVMSDVVKELQVPMVSFSATDPALSSLQFPYIVRTTQSDLYQMAAIAEMVDYYGWREVIAVFIDDDFGRNGIDALGDALSKRRCKVSYKGGIHPGATVSRTEILDLLIKVSMLESRVIVLHVNPGFHFMVFDVANYLQMMGNGFVWISTDSFSSVLDSSYYIPSRDMNTVQGVLVLRQHSPHSYKKSEFFARWNKLTGSALGLNYYGLCAYDTVWLIAHAINEFFNQGGVISFSMNERINLSHGEWSRLHLERMSMFDEGMLLLKIILESDFDGLTGPIKFDSSKSRILPAYDIMNVVGTGFRRIGYWSNYSGLSTVAPEALYERPANHSSANQHLYSVIWPGETTAKPRGWVFPNNGKQLRIGVPDRVGYKEFVYKVSGVDNNDTFKGFCIDVFQAAVNLLPYAVPYKFVSFGNGYKNPSYTDLVNSIATGFIDGAVGDIAIVTNRTKIVDFTQPYVASGLVILARFKSSHTGGWAFMVPFSPQMWCVIASFFGVVGFIVWILEHRINDDFRGPPKKQIMTVVWFSLSTLFFAHRENTMSTLGRLVLLLWLFVVLIINSSYTASLTSILTVQHFSSPIKGIESLKENDDPIGFQVGSFSEHYLEGLGISKSRLVPLGSPEEYAKKLLIGPENGGVGAVVDERPYVEHFLSRRCDFRIIGQDFTKSGWGFAFPLDSPLSVDLSTAILSLSENGDLEQIHDKWFTANACNLENNELESNQLHFSSFSGLFAVCGIVCAVALLIHFFQIMRQFRRASCMDDRVGSSHIRRIRTLLSIMDEKRADRPKNGKKRPRLE